MFASAWDQFSQRISAYFSLSFAAHEEVGVAKFAQKRNTHLKKLVK